MEAIIIIIIIFVIIIINDYDKNAYVKGDSWIGLTVGHPFCTLFLNSSLIASICN